jgi:hypothetical protein
MNWLVKLARGEWETVLFGFKSLTDALAKRDELREQYQTDEYYVEAFQPEKLQGFVLPNRAPYDKCSAHLYVEAGKEQKVEA